jgi:hypothetical protein
LQSLARDVSSKMDVLLDEMNTNVEKMDEEVDEGLEC